jgi:phosphotransacetylase
MSQAFSIRVQQSGAEYPCAPDDTVLRAGLRAVGLAPDMKTLSSVFFMISPQADRVLVFGDCGVVPEPNAQQLADIALCAADNFKNVTGETPKVALLSFSTKGSAKHASIDTLHEALKLIRERRPDLAVDGEMQFDAAFVPAIGQRKAPNSKVAGQANVFIFPNLAAGNIGYKLAERLGGYTALGPMIQGLKHPLHDLSRGCSAEDMVQTALLAMRMHPLKK